MWVCYLKKPQFRDGAEVFVIIGLDAWVGERWRHSQDYLLSGTADTEITPFWRISIDEAPMSTW